MGGCCGKNEEEKAAPAQTSVSSGPEASASTVETPIPIAVQPPVPTVVPVKTETPESTTPSGPTPTNSEDLTVTTRQMKEHVVPEELNIITPTGYNQPQKAAVAEGHGPIGSLELAPTAYIIKGLSDPEARKARRSMKKDKTGVDFDSKRKEYVYDYLNTEGGWIVDPADKKKHCRVNPGDLAL